MKLIYLYIEGYKKFIKNEIYFTKTQESNNLAEKIFKNLNITALIGENGTGKTTIMSFIVSIFRYLQRYHDKIPSDFIIKYSICNHIVQIRRSNKNVYFVIDDSEEKLLLEYNIKNGYKRKKNQINIENRDITYEDIIPFLPKNIVVSFFDIDYPSNYNYNYIGHRNVIVKSGYDHFNCSFIGLNLSLGIVQFYNKYYSNNSSLFEILKSMGIIFNENVLMYSNIENYADYGEMKENLIKHLGKYNLNNLSKIVDDIFRNRYFSQYYDKNYFSVDNIPSEKFNIKKFILDNSYNAEILYFLTANNLIYINDIFINSNNAVYSTAKMSTGEKILFGRIFFIMSNITNNSIIVIEEIDVFLNNSWIKQITSILIELCNSYNCHFFISSHNPTFIQSLFSDQIIIMDENNIKSADFNTLLGIEEELNQKVFSKYMNHNYIEKYVKDAITSSNIDSLLSLFNNMGESYWKFIVFEQLVEMGIFHVENNK